jgi:hypothetical protein
MVNYTEAIKRPFSDIKTLAVGILISIIPIVNFIAMGYMLKCAKTAMAGKKPLPEWEAYGNLFVKGVVAALIALAYVIIPVLIIGISLGTAILSYFGGVAAGMMGGAGSMAAIGSAGIGIIVGGILYLIAMYFIPAALMNYAKTEQASSAFKLREVFKKALSVDYLIVWLVVAVYAMILGVITSIIPIIGFGISSFVVGVTAFTLFGELYLKEK